MNRLLHSDIVAIFILSYVLIQTLLNYGGINKGTAEPRNFGDVRRFVDLKRVFLVKTKSVHILIIYLLNAIHEVQMSRQDQKVLVSRRFLRQEEEQLVAVLIE